MTESKGINMSNKLKVAILTQPLHNNYGGLLQAYALKEVLKQRGHEVTIINRRTPTPSKFRLLAHQIKMKLISKTLNPKLQLTEQQKKIISLNTDNFVNQYIPELSELITSNHGMRNLNNQNFDAYIVGSDQCWRPIYSPKIENFFLDFAEHTKNIKRVSYAASFGTSDWEFNKKQTETCKKLLKKFDAISVREKSAISLVQTYLNRSDAVHVLDPTMLLSKDQYNNIIKAQKIEKSPGSLNVYVLDKNPKKEAFISNIEKQLGLKQFEVMPKKRINTDKVIGSNINDFQYPHPASWIKAFEDAEFVITDSFHGTLFSILYNVPFITLGNKHRGMARFKSLLETFNLSERLVSDIQSVDIDSLLKMHIDWEDVNETISSKRNASLSFLEKALD